MMSIKRFSEIHKVVPIKMIPVKKITQNIECGVLPRSLYHSDTYVQTLWSQLTGSLHPCSERQQETKDEPV